MLNVVLILGYIVLVLLIGFLSSRKSSTDDFMINKRNLGPIALAGTVAATMIGGNALITYSAFIFKWGIGVLWAIVGFGFGIWILAKIGKKLKEQGKRYYTLSDFFHDKYGKRTGLIVTVIVVFWFLMILLIQYIAGGKIISSLTGIPYWLSVLIMGGIVFIYSFLGGFKAVVKTDVFQYLLFLVLAIFLGITAFRGVQVDSSSFDVMSMGIGTTIAFILLGAGTIFTGPDMWQRVYAAKDKKSINRGLVIATIAIFVGFFVIGLIGMAAKSQAPGISSEEAFLYGINNLIPKQFLGLVFVLLFAVVMSTLDTLLFVLATNFSQDIITKNINPDVDKVKYTKIGMLIFAFLSMFIAIFVQSIISLGLAFASLGLVFAPAILWAFFLKKELKPKAIQLSLITGFIAVFIVLLFGYIGPETSTVSLPVAILFLLLGQLIFRKDEAQVLPSS